MILKSTSVGIYTVSADSNNLCVHVDWTYKAQSRLSSLPQFRLDNKFPLSTENISVDSWIESHNVETRRTTVHSSGLSLNGPDEQEVNSKIKTTSRAHHPDPPTHLENSDTSPWQYDATRTEVDGPVNPLLSYNPLFQSPLSTSLQRPFVPETSAIQVHVTGTECLWYSRKWCLQWSPCWLSSWSVVHGGRHLWGCRDAGTRHPYIYLT
jgi:hypothetical protein